MLRHDRTIEIHSTVSVSELINAVQTAPEEILRFVIADGVAVAETEKLNELAVRAKARRKRLVFYANDEDLVQVFRQSGFLVKPRDSFQAKREYFRALAEGSLLDRKVSDIVVSPKTGDIAPRIRKVVQPKVKTSTKSVKKRPTTEETAGFLPEEIAEPAIIRQPAAVEEERISWRQRILAIKGKRGYLVVFVVAVVALLALVSTFVLASAEITVTAKRETTPIELKVKADTKTNSVNLSSLLIPAQFFKLDRSATARFNATGQAVLNQKARGSLTVFNNYSSQAQPLVAGTRFRESGGKIFRLIRGVTVPGAKVEEGKIIASSVKVDVEADQAGPEYNIGPTTFVIPGFEGTPKFNGFSAKSEQAMSGGSSGVTAEVTAQDLANAGGQLQGAMFNQLEDALRAQLPRGVVWNEKLKSKAMVKKVDSLTFSAKAGQRVADFEGKIKATLSVLVFKEEDVTSLINQRLAGSITAEKKLEKIAPLDYDVAVFDPDKESLVFTGRTEATLVWNVSQPEVIRRVKGKSETEIKNAIKQMSAVQKARVSFWPFWRDSAPKKESRIKITIE